MTGTKIKQILSKRWVKICGGLVVATTLFFLLLPFGVKYYLADWLKKNGADSATIAKLWFNPFIGRVSMGGMDVQIGGKSILHNASMLVDMGFTSLFHHDIRVEKAEYTDLAIDLEQYKDGSWRFGSYTMAGQKQQTKVKSSEDAASAWNFLADQVSLTNCNVHLKTPDINLTLTIAEAQLNRFSTRSGQPAGTFTFKGRLNGSPVALDLDTVQLVPELRIGGTLSVEGFKLADLSRMLRDVLPTLAGETGLDGKLLFSREKDKGLQVNYDGKMAVTGLDLGNDEMSTSAGDLSWKGKVSYDGVKGSQLKVETDGLLAIQGLHLVLAASDLVVEQKNIELSGKTHLTMAQNIQVDHEGSLRLAGLELALPPYGITEQSLSWKGKLQYDSDHKEAGLFVSTDGLLDLGEFQVGGGKEDASFAVGGKTVSWQGVIDLNRKDAGQGVTVALDGTLSGGDILATLMEPQLRIGQEKVELTTKSAIGFGESVDIKGQSDLDLLGFDLFEGKNNDPLLSFDQLAVTGVDGQGGRAITVKEVTTKGLQSVIAGNVPLRITIPEITLEDIATTDLMAFTAGGLTVKEPLVTAVQNNKELVRLQDLQISEISLDEGATVTAGDVFLQKLVFLGANDDPARKAAVSFAKSSLNAVSWSKDAGFLGGTLHFDDLTVKVVRDKEGKINISERLAAMQSQESEQESGRGEVAGVEKSPEAKAEPAAAGQANGVPFKLRKIEVAGKSAVAFEDYTLTVPYSTDLAISKLEVGEIDSSKPDRKTALLLKGELDKRAPLEVAGDLAPFKAEPAVNLKVELKNYPLSSLSAYTVQSVGTALASGQLQIESSIALADEKLDMKNSVLLKKLETKTIDPKLAAELNNQLPIPIDAALSMLRDSDRNIALDVPLSGPVSDLNVGISDVLITALGKAIVPAASGYLMYALGPYGALAYVGMKVGEKMLQVKLPPVVFVQQEVTLTNEHLKYLQRIGKILQDRPETDIQICPRVASWEFMTKQQKEAIKGNEIPVDEKNREQLLELGQQRARAVQSLLEKEYKVDRDRLLICDTEIATPKSAVPAVLLQL